ncbi:MAG: amidohydrolase family protein [Parvibaculum sp.]
MANFDLIIRGGSLADGTGAPVTQTDIAIKDGCIAHVGPLGLDVEATEIMDATGLLVTPGWVDVHTHYDGQVTWDSYVTPSSLHGVTTVVMGNCGVGFAPVRPADHQTLISLMEGVEDIPGAALHEGLSWNWESFPDYLDAIEERAHDIDVAAQVPHGALRVYVMGARGVALEKATQDDIRTMGELTRDAVKAGALGFTTSRTILHKTAEGDAVPTYDADREELVGIAKLMGEADAGVLQVVSDFAKLGPEFETLEEMVALSGRPLSLTVAQADVMPGRYQDILKHLEAANDKGLEMRGQVANRPVGLLLGLQGSVHPFITYPSYQGVARLPLPERVAKMKDPEFRKQLLSEAPQKGNVFANHIASSYDKMFRLGTPPNYEPEPDTSIAALATRKGVQADELAYDILLEDEGREFLYFPFLNYAAFDLDAVHEMLAHPNTIPGLSDGGAHVGAICDASFPTYMLIHWARDRSRGDRFDLAWLVKRQTRDTAVALGLLDRGLVAKGYKADLNLIDFEKLSLEGPRMVFDLPANTRRLMQGAEGYVATIVSGQVIRRHGKATGVLPGKLVRGAQSDPVRVAAE